MSAGVSLSAPVSYLKATVTNVLVDSVNAQTFVLVGIGHVGQLAEVDPPLGVAVRVICIPMANACITCPE